MRAHQFTANHTAVGAIRVSKGRASMSHFPGLSATKARRSTCSSWIVGNEGEALHLFANDQSVEPERFPAVVQSVKQPEMMPVQMHDMLTTALIADGKAHAATPGDGEQRVW